MASRNRIFHLDRHKGLRYIILCIQGDRSSSMDRREGGGLLC